MVNSTRLQGVGHYWYLKHVSPANHDEDLEMYPSLNAVQEWRELLGMENSQIFQNAEEGLERNGFSRKLNHKPWPFPVLNMLSNNWNSISANSVMLQQQRKCKICQKTDTPLWRKGPDGTDLSYTRLTR